MTVWYFGVNPDPARLLHGNILQFWCLVIVSFLIGAATYALMAHPAARKPAFQRKKRFPRWQAVVAGGGLAGMLIIIAYRLNWAVFYRMDVRGDEIRLAYFYPQRTVALSRDALARLRTADCGRNQVCLRLETTDGGRYVSQAMSRWAYQRQLPQIEAALGMQG